ncbi:MAG: family 10 glycosylhydrolase [Candidatus Latescibacteria bacterium]|nr:family 10 glycosylhydrolase [Candidatus Latescibacterota bacterium]
MTQTTQRWAPRGDHRLLFVSDPSSIAVNLLPDPTGPEDLRRWVDMVADGGADTLVQEVYNQGYSVYWQSEQLQYDQRPQHRRFLPMLEAGDQPLSVLIDQSHRRGLRCLAGFRINDDHNFPAYAEFYEAHPEFALVLPEGEYYRYGKPLDFTFDAVREYLYAPMQEVASRFEVDGLELCFRDHGYFPRESGRERAHLMTDLLRRVRVMLDEEGRKKGRRMILGARVFSTLEECAELGLDVESWIGAGLLDYLSPGDVMFTDFSLPLDEFAALTRPSTCMLYPGMYPWTSSRARSRLDQLPLSPATCRAFAQTVYGSGGDGLSVYNHFCTIWHAPFYPQSLGTLRQLRDPSRVLAAERHYLFDPTWAGQTGFGGEGRGPTGAVRANQLVLSREVQGAAGEYRFPLFEEMAELAGGTLLFRGFGLTEDDELEVRLNGQVIADGLIGRTRAADAPVDWGHVRQVGERRLKCIPEQGRIDFRAQKEPAFSTRWFALKDCLVAWGWNRLEIHLARSDPQASGLVVIDEVEVFVAPQ